MTDRAPPGEAAGQAVAGQAVAGQAVAVAGQAAAAALEAAHRREWGQVLAATARVTRDLDLAEECVQEAYAAALRAWPAAGVPDRPAAWLTTAARRRAVDVIRRDSALRARLPLLVVPEEAEAGPSPADLDGGDPWPADPGDLLRLVFTGCHPALSPEAQVALTLRLACGVATGDIARAFLVPEATMAARITRAKKKIAAARIPFRIPGPAERPARLAAVLNVVHLLFTAGHTAPSGPGLVRADLVERALALTAALRALLPDEPEVRGLQALLLITDARRAARTDDAGRLVRLEDQDRGRWDGAALATAEELITGCLRAGPPGRYVLQAAIASVYAAAPGYAETDWPQLVALYDALLRVWPSPAAALSRAVPLAMTDGPAAALAEVERLEATGRLSGYQYLPAVKADLLARLGRDQDAAVAYRQALALTANEAERDFLAGRLGAMGEAGQAASVRGKRGV